MNTELNLGCLEEWQRKYATEAFAKRNGREFAAAGSHSSLALVADNYKILKAKEMYENALVEGFIGCKVNNRAWSIDMLTFMLDTANRKKLLAAGSTLPGIGPFTVYRGVSGIGRARKVRGLSWSFSLDVACWFATRMCQPHPAVHCAVIDARDVYFYYTERGEDELVARPISITRMKLQEQEIMERADRWSEAKDKQEASAGNRRHNPPARP